MDGISQSLCAPEVEGIKTKVELRRVHESPRTHKLSTLMAFMGHSKDTAFWQRNRAGLGKKLKLVVRPTIRHYPDLLAVLYK